jgi:hypothetical protein
VAAIAKHLEKRIFLCERARVIHSSDQGAP